MNPADPTPYDQIRYPGHAYRQTHPDRLASLATLLGMRPVPADCCRVLELGCGTGANLIPMAWALPGSRFFGIDLAANPIADGRATVEHLGLDNIRLESIDLMDLPESLGTFDYIVAHGLYSWVPPAVQDRLMTLCRRHLAENGVAFISYNTYPGCHIRDMVREMLLYHVHNAPDPQTKIRQAQALLKFLADAQTEPDEYGHLLLKELQRVMQYSVGHFFHDDLAPINQPLYFHQFMERAQRAGLQFLSEAEYFMIKTDQFPEQTAQVLATLGGNILIQQQYLDFLRCRRFRQTLLCHQEISLDHDVQAHRMTGFSFSSPCKASSVDPDLCSEREEEFQGEQGSRLRTTNPLAKAALAYLGSRWPLAVPFDAIINEALRCLGRQETAEDADTLGAILQSSFGSGLLELHLLPPRLTIEPGEYPQASPFARLQAQKGNLITTLRHRSVCLDNATALKLLQMLDGTRNVAALTAELSQTADQPPVGEQEVRLLLADFARLGLLVR
jgi:SAM-dependent methyltransferase